MHGKPAVAKLRLTLPPKRSGVRLKV